MKPLFNKIFLAVGLSIISSNLIEAIFVKGMPHDFNNYSLVYVGMHNKVYKELIPDESKRISFMVSHLLEIFTKTYANEYEFAVMRKNIVVDNTSLGEYLGQVSFKLEGSKIWFIEASHKDEVSGNDFSTEFLAYIRKNYPQVKTAYGPGMSGDSFKIHRERLENLGFVRIEDEEENAEAIKYVNIAKKPVALGYKLAISE